MQKTGIEYLDYTWNPIAMRCTPVSPGCANCWHLKVCDRHAKNPKLTSYVREAKAGGPPFLITNELAAPSNVEKPSKIGVQFMGDLFHEKVCEYLTNRVSVKMDFCQQHIFIVLTKRPDRAVSRLRWGPNLWLGVSCENQEWADKRIPILLQIPAAVRFVSLEPLLEPIRLKPPLTCPRCGGCGNGKVCYLCDGRGKVRLLDWVIVGCESGPKRRPCKLEWVRDIIQQCKAASVPVFVKQLSINGKVSHDPAEWPEELRIRQWPKNAADVD